MQHRATKLLPDITNLSYSERLQKLNLPTLVYRRLRGDMIEVFKILHNFYNPNVCDFLPRCQYPSTRGHNYKLFIQPSRTNTRRNFFSIRTSDIWNHLPRCVVNAPTIKSFEHRLDTCWSDIRLKFDLNSKICYSEFKALNNADYDIYGELDTEVLS